MCNWIALASTCCVPVVSEVVVDFKLDTHKRHLVFDAEFANMDAESNYELVLIENGYNETIYAAVSTSHTIEDSRKIAWR